MMFQRYPDGARAWMLFVWSRHPKWSQTWTHSLSLSRYRRSSGVSLRPRFGFLGEPSLRGQWGRSLSFLRLELIMLRQRAIGPNDPQRVVDRLAWSIYNPTE